MQIRNIYKSARLALIAAALSACAHSAAGPQRTEALPADGGEVGKAFLEYVKAIDAGDGAAFAKRIAVEDADLNVGVVRTMFGNLGGYKPIGGRRQGDRATLFVDTGTKNGDREILAMWDAGNDGNGWRFDGPAQQVAATYYGSYDCAKEPVFPCGLTSAPDSVVSGSVTPLKYDTFVHKTPPVFAMIDGFAVRFVDADAKMPKRTRVVLSNMAFLPEFLVHMERDPDALRFAFSAPLLQIDISADGKTAHVALWDHNAVKKADVKDGLTLDVNDGKRIRGRLKTDVADLMGIDVHFDLATGSTCYSGDRCGKD